MVTFVIHFFSTDLDHTIDIVIVITTQHRQQPQPPVEEITCGYPGMILHVLAIRSSIYAQMHATLYKAELQCLQCSHSNRYRRRNRSITLNAWMTNMGIKQRKDSGVRSSQPSLAADVSNAIPSFFPFLLFFFFVLTFHIPPPFLFFSSSFFNFIVHATAFNSSNVLYLSLAICLSTSF